MTTPDAIEIVAYRMWRVVPGGLLASLGNCAPPEIWTPYEPMTAVCFRKGRVGCPPEYVPTPEHSCGIHGFKRLEDARRYARIGLVLGMVYLWGRVIEEESLYRAQYAYPAALLKAYGGSLSEASDAYGLREAA